MMTPNSIAVAVRKGLYFSVPAMALVATQAIANTQQDQDVETIKVTAQALKIESPAQETPRSVSVIDEEQLRERAPQKLDEALRYTAGVTAQPYGADNDTDWFKVRGFDAATYLDGNRLFRDGYYTWLVEPYALEAVEVVKGPSAILFGESAPGGIVNGVQKKPTYTPQGEVRVEVGNNDLTALGFDIADNANEDGTVRYRLVGMLKGNDGELDGTNNERIYLAPSVEIDINDRTMLTVLSSYLKDDGVPTNPFFPAAGTIIDSDFGTIDPSTNLGQPDYDKYQRTQFSFGYKLTHEYNDTWTFNQNLNYGYNELFLRSSYAFSNNDPSVSELAQGIVFRDGKTQSITFDNNAVANWFQGRNEHTLLLGFDLQYHHTEGVEQDDYTFGSIDWSNPEYGNYTPIDSFYNLDRDIKKSQASVYAQHQFKYADRLVTSIGARYDWVKTENRGYGYLEDHWGINDGQPTLLDQDESRNDGQLSLNAGVMYKADYGLSPYASYSESFEVISVIDPITNEIYKPLVGKQYEVGVKYTPDFIDGFVNLAYFDITQENALVTTPDFSTTQTGEVTSKGIELDAAAQLTDSVKLIANYTYTDAKTDETGGQGAKRVALIPEHQASAWVNYDAFSLVPGLSVGTGVRYIGESKDNPMASDLTVPSVTLLDAAVTYDLNSQWQAQLNVNNLLDEEYISGCDYWCYYGQSRSVVFNVNYRW
ncbi:TonB-dependent siderophore receptor [Vibrio sp. WXL210]|uniref:TonB-dependent siderophore receptor n=1 Tax=Vibrio sp. WXL210 TaxID=3450709 RepID=UPI003EC54C3F